MNRHNLSLSLAFLLFVFCKFSLIGQYYTLKSAGSENAGYITESTGTWSSVTDPDPANSPDLGNASVSIAGVSENSEVLVVVTFTVRSKSTTSSMPSFKITSGTASCIPISKRMIGGIGTDSGTGSCSYIFSYGPGQGGDKTYTFEHKADNSTSPIETKASISAVELGSGSNLSLSNDMAEYPADVTLSGSSSTFTSDANWVATVSNPIKAGVFVSASFNNTTHGNSVVGRWCLEYSDNGTVWNPLETPTESIINSKSDVGIISLLSVDTVVSQTRYYRLAHRKVSGSGNLVTRNVTVTAVALGYDEGYFPGFKSINVNGKTTNGTDWEESHQLKITPEHPSTAMIAGVQLNASASGPLPSAKMRFDMYENESLFSSSLEYDISLPSSAVVSSVCIMSYFDGLSSGSTYFESLVQKSGTSGVNLSSSNIILCGFQFTSITDASWVGGTAGSENDWAVASNWSPAIVPDLYADVTVPSGATNEVNIGGNFMCHNFTVESGAAPVIISAGNLTIDGDLTVNGSLTIESDDTESGTLIVLGESTGEITYNRYMAGGAGESAKWHLIGSPVIGQLIGTGGLLDNTSGDNSIARNGSLYAMSDYNEANNEWNPYFTAAVPGNFISGSGYQVLRNSDGPISFTGAVETGNVIKAISLDASGYGWNCISNPYPSSIDINVGTSNFLGVNSAAINDSFEAIYYWDADASTPGYVVINNATDYHIPPGQAFFIKAASETTIEIREAMQSHTTSNFKSVKSCWPEIKLKVESADYDKNTRILFNSDMTRGLDVSYDAGLFKSNSNFSLYTRLVEGGNGVDFAIQCLPEDFDELVIPVGLDAKAGDEITFTAEMINMPEQGHCYIEDREAKTYVRLDQPGASYSVKLSNKNLKTGTFFIHTSAKTLAMDNTDEKDYEVKIAANHAEEYLRIIGDVDPGTEISIINMAGQKIKTGKLQNMHENTFNIQGLQAGIYIVQVQKGNKQVREKIYWQ